MVFMVRPHENTLIITTQGFLRMALRISIRPHLGFSEHCLKGFLDQRDGDYCITTIFLLRCTM